MVTCNGCKAQNDVTKTEPGTRVSCCKCGEVFEVPARGVETAGTAKKKPGLALETLSDEELLAKCKPVLIYYICTPITDPKNPNWVFSRKLEMQCFSRDDVATVLKNEFTLEKVNIDYKLATRRGQPVPAEGADKPVASSWDYRMTRVIFTSFDGKKKLHEMTAKDGEAQLKSSASFGNVLKQVQAEHAKYLKELRKAAQEAAKAKA